MEDYCETDKQADGSLHYEKKGPQDGNISLLGSGRVQRWPQRTEAPVDNSSRPFQRIAECRLDREGHAQFHAEAAASEPHVQIGPSHVCF